MWRSRFVIERPRRRITEDDERWDYLMYRTEASLPRSLWLARRSRLARSGSTALRLYTTTDVTQRRIYTLMHDPQYRMQVVGEQTAYNQPPHPGFHIGNGMATPPAPNIKIR